jgi:CBS domain containing-hemolysin-like protein
VSTPLRIVIVLVLVLGNAVFVAAEYALVTGRRSRLEERAARGRRGARTALRLMDDPVRFISTIQVGITVFAILLGAIGEPLVCRRRSRSRSPSPSRSTGSRASPTPSCGPWSCPATRSCACCG